VGLSVADGEGNFTEAVRTVSVRLGFSSNCHGTYTVNPNGTGSAVLHVNFGSGPLVTETFAFVIVNGGREAIGTNPGVVIRGVAVKQ
jgi:hypothetical protein